MVLRQGFEPCGNGLGDLDGAAGPLPDGAFVPVEDSSDTPLGPFEAVEAFAETGRGHPPNTFTKATPAANMAAPAVMPPNAMTQGASLISCRLRS